MTTVMARPDGTTIPRAGLELPPGTSYQRWVLIGRSLSHLHGSSAWCLGDWLIHGEAHYVGRYREAVELCSLNHQTLRNYAWIARRFTLSRRRDNLSFGHHAEVAALPEPEQDYWLRKAEDLGWSRRQMRAEVRSSVKERTESRKSIDVTHAEDDDSLSESDGISLSCNREQVDLWRAAAESARLSVDAWAVSQLDRAARALMISA